MFGLSVLYAYLKPLKVDSLRFFAIDTIVVCLIIYPLFAILNVISSPSLVKHYYPRIITTSYLNIYERFWNYLLMNWSIHQLPRYTYDEKTGIYTKQSELMDFHVSDREMELKEELEKIKAKTSLDERYIYLK